LCNIEARRAHLAAVLMQHQSIDGACLVAGPGFQVRGSFLADRPGCVFERSHKVRASVGQIRKIF
jgi:hypothetical protein